MHLKVNKFKLATLALVIISFSHVAAQDIDRKRVDVNYIKLPVNALPTEVSTYFVYVKSKNTSWGNTLGNIYDGEKIIFNGYYRLPDASDADVIVESEVVNDLVYDKADEKSVELTYKKDKNSATIKYIAHYYYVTYYSPKIHYTLRTKTGKTVVENFIGGERYGFDYGSTNYSDYFSNSYSLASAWQNDKNSLMAKDERETFQAALISLQSTCLSYCMVPAKVDYAVRYVDEKKGRTEYVDLLQARDYYLEAISTIQNDKINMINKLVQPDYENRRDTMKKAIDLWEKALAEADFDNKKARINSKVARHLYYNLALAYLWIDDFVKAKEYAQGRKKDLGSWDKNLLSGIRDLSALIDDRAARQDANKWRTTLLTDSNVYVYKDPVTRKHEQEAELTRQAAEKAARADSIKVAKTNLKKGGKSSARSTAKKTPANTKSSSKALTFGVTRKKL